MRELLASGIPIERIVHVNFDDDRLAAMTASDLHWLVDLHAEMFPGATDQKCYYFLDELQDVIRMGALCAVAHQFASCPAMPYGVIGEDAVGGHCDGDVWRF